MGNALDGTPSSRHGALLAVERGELLLYEPAENRFQHDIVAVDEDRFPVAEAQFYRRRMDLRFAPRAKGHPLFEPEGTDETQALIRQIEHPRVLGEILRSGSTGTGFPLREARIVEYLILIRGDV